ncbi:MAG: CopG family transcriptional regulator [Euryarchaeota archaeon]|nr:CopG family transcriptional regulator [Euryarchaeota archaeon]
MSDARITLRLNDVELEEIDDFIARHPEFHNRSEFVRQVIMEYIRRAHEEEISRVPETAINAENPDPILLGLEEYVEYGYFRDMQDAITYILRECLKQGILTKILKEYTELVRSVYPDESLRISGGIRVKKR